MANKTGLSKETIINIEAGGKRPSVGNLLQISRALHIDSSLFLKEQDEALESFRQAVEHDPDLWEASQYMGTILSEMGRTSEALMYYEKVLEKHPDDELQAWVDAQKAQTQ